MPTKKIDSKEKKVLEKRQSVKRKLSFVLVLAALVLAANAFVSRSQSDVQTVVQELEEEKETQNILGESTKDEKERLERVQKQTRQLAENVTTATEEVVTESKERLEQTISDFVYSSTIQPLINKINGLPDDQQDYIKEAICRPE